MFDKGYTKCSCPIVIRGTLKGKFVSLSTARYLPPDHARSLEAARDFSVILDVPAKVRPDKEFKGEILRICGPDTIEVLGN